MADDHVIERCLYCQRSLPQPSGRGRPRLYCREACRSAAARYRRSTRNDTVTCSIRFGQTRTGWRCTNSAVGNIVVRRQRGAHVFRDPQYGYLDGGHADDLHQGPDETLVCLECRPFIEAWLKQRGLSPTFRPLRPWETSWSQRRARGLGRNPRQAHL